MVKGVAPTSVTSRPATDPATPRPTLPSAAPHPFLPLPFCRIWYCHLAFLALLCFLNKPRNWNQSGQSENWIFQKTTIAHALRSAKDAEIQAFWSGIILKYHQYHHCHYKYIRKWEYIKGIYFTNALLYKNTTIIGKQCKICHLIPVLCHSQHILQQNYL